MIGTRFANFGIAALRDPRASIRPTHVPGRSDRVARFKPISHTGTTDPAAFSRLDDKPRRLTISIHATRSRGEISKTFPGRSGKKFDFRERKKSTLSWTSHTTKRNQRDNDRDTVEYTVSACVYVCVCVCVCVCARARARVCVCVCVLSEMNQRRRRFRRGRSTSRSNVQTNSTLDDAATAQVASSRGR